LPCFTFQKSLSENECTRMIDEVIRWTAGPPRPLLYVFHMMQMLSSNPKYFEMLKTKQGLKEVFNMLFQAVAAEETLEKELGAVTRRGGLSLDAEQRAYNYFCFASWQQSLLTPQSLVPGTSTRLDCYLRSFNIFASAVGSKIQLFAPAFVSRFLYERT